MSKKVVLAYSGGLDTSVIMKWLQDQYGYEVIAMIGNLGQNEDIEAATKKAYDTGAVKVYVEDLRKEFIEDFIYPTLRSGAIYEGKYLLGTSFGRPLIAKRQVEIAQKENATAVSHGATGKGNDQVRFELTYMALNPKLEIIAPWKDPNWELTSREKMLDYAEKHNIAVSVSKKKIYSEDANIWHISHEGGSLENPMNEPEENVFTYSKTVTQALNEPEYVEIEFEKGIPISVNGKKLDGIGIVNILNEIGARHAIGQADMVENRLVGMKSRGVYETPGGAILYRAYREIEELVMDRDSMHYRQMLAVKYAEIVYNGQWYAPLRVAFDRFFDSLHSNTTGVVRLKLFKGNIITAGKKSPNSLYIDELASFGETGLYDHKDAIGFIKLLGLPMKVRALKKINFDGFSFDE